MFSVLTVFVYWVGIFWLYFYTMHSHWSNTITYSGGGNLSEKAHFTCTGKMLNTKTYSIQNTQKKNSPSIYYMNNRFNMSRSHWLFVLCSFFYYISKLVSLQSVYFIIFFHCTVFTSILFYTIKKKGRVKCRVDVIIRIKHKYERGGYIAWDCKRVAYQRL